MSPASYASSLSASSGVEDYEDYAYAYEVTRYEEAGYTFVSAVDCADLHNTPINTPITPITPIIPFPMRIPMGEAT
jgi:hypothetical protein